MRFWLALFIVALSLMAARAQISQRPLSHELPELTPEEEAKCLNEARRRRECDNILGCFSLRDPAELDVVREAAQCRLQQRANKALLKELETQRRSK
jgi:hypothetical protein